MGGYVFVAYPVASVAALWQILWDPKGSLAAAVPVPWGAPPRQRTVPSNETPLQQSIRELREDVDELARNIRLVLTAYFVVASVLALVGICYHSRKWLKANMGKHFNALHRKGVLELLAYVLALALSVYGYRLQEDLPDLAASMSLLGGLSSWLCWAYSVHSRGLDECDEFNDVPTYPKTFGGGIFASATLVPLAVLHRSPMIGFFAVFAAHLGAATYLRSSNLVDTLSAASLAASSGVTVFFAGGLRALALVDYDKARGLFLFADGATVFGHVGLFASALVRSARVPKKARKEDRSEPRFLPPGSLVFLGCLVTSMLGSLAFDAPGLRSTTFVFMLLWLMVQQIQISSDGSLGRWVAKASGVIITSQYLITNWHHLVDMLNPQGLYVF